MSSRGGKKLLEIKHDKRETRRHVKAYLAFHSHWKGRVVRQEASWRKLFRIRLFRNGLRPTFCCVRKLKGDSSLSTPKMDLSTPKMERRTTTSVTETAS